jgi:ribose 5-phosphate isomerase A
MAAPEVIRRFEAMGGQAQLRMKEGRPLVTDNGQHLVDVKGLQIHEPLSFEDRVSQWPGVVTVGVFAHQRAHVCLLGTATGVQTLQF